MTEDIKKNPIVLSIKNLNLYFKTHGKDSHVIRGIDLDIKRGEVFAIVGESGSGKSVFTKTFTGMIESNGKIKTGSIILNDIPLNDPKIIRRKFSDINRHKRAIIRSDKKEYHNFIEAQIAKETKKYIEENEKLSKEQNLWTDKGYQESLKKVEDEKKTSREAYLGAFYTDKITNAYNDVSNNAIKKQAITDKFLNKVNKILDDKAFENRENHTETFKEVLNKNLNADQNFLSYKASFEEFEKELEKYEESSPEQKETLIKKEKCGYKYSKEFERVFFKSLHEYKSSQVIKTPLNPMAYEDLLDELKTPIQGFIAKYNPTLEAKAREADSEVASLISKYTTNASSSLEGIKDLTRKAIELKNSVLIEFVNSYEGSLLEELDFSDHDSISYEFNQLLNYSRKVQVIRQKMSLFTNLNNPDYLALVEVLSHIEKSIFKEVYPALIHYLYDNINTVSSEHSSNIRRFYSGILNLSEEYIYCGVNTRKEIYSLRVKEVRNERVSAFAELNKKHKERLEEIKNTSHSDEKKIAELQAKIDSNNAAIEKITKDLKEKEKNTCAELTSVNEPIIKANKLDPKYVTYPTKYVSKLAKGKAQIEALVEKVETLEKEIIKEKEKALQLLEKGDLDSVFEVCHKIQFGTKYYRRRYIRAEKDKKNKLLQVSEKLANLPNDSRRDELKHILEVEQESINSNYEALITQITNEFRKALSVYSVGDHSEVIELNDKIHNIQEEVSSIRIIYRKIRKFLTIRPPLIASLRNSGVIRDNNINLAKLKTNREWSIVRGSHIATIFQDPMTSLNPLLTIGSQISDVLRLHHNLTRSESKEEAINLLRRVHIPNPEVRYKEYPYQYSGGMRQRVVIAIALACRPDILICDEPTTALDVTVQAQILELIKDLQKEYEFTTIFITHDLGVVAGVADRIGVMYGGQFVEIGTDEDIFYHSSHPYTWALLSSLPQLAVESEPLVYIRGNPPVFTKEIEGDAFAPRSDYAMRIDTMIEPPMFKISETHYAKTWLLDPRAPKVKKPAIIRNLSERMKKTADSFLATEKGE